MVMTRTETGFGWAVPAGSALTPLSRGAHNIFIAGPEVCATPVQETSHPILLSFNGCPRPDIAAMGLKGYREPDKPFLDIFGGSSAGACFSCPTVDENGDILVTERNLNPLTDRNNNSGCQIRFRWTPPVFPEPGLSFERNTFLRPCEDRRLRQCRMGEDHAEPLPKRDRAVHRLRLCSRYCREIAGRPHCGREEAAGFV
jgi:hypothetical protein